MAIIYEKLKGNDPICWEAPPVPFAAGVQGNAAKRKKLGVQLRRVPLQPEDRALVSSALQCRGGLPAAVVH